MYAGRLPDRESSLDAIVVSRNRIGIYQQFRKLQHRSKRDGRDVALQDVLQDSSNRLHIGGTADVARCDSIPVTWM